MLFKKRTEKVEEILNEVATHTACNPSLDSRSVGCVRTAEQFKEIEIVNSSDFYKVKNVKFTPAQAGVN